MFKQLGAVLLVTTTGIISSGALVGVVGGLIVAALFVVVPAARTDVVLRHVKIESGVLHTPTEHLLIARLSGPLTFLSRGRLLALLDAPPWPRYLVLDVSDVTLVDSGGMDELEDLVDFLSIRGGEVVVVGCSNLLRERLVDAGVMTKLAGETVFGNVGAALETLDVVTEEQPRLPELARAAGW